MLPSRTIQNSSNKFYFRCISASDIEIAHNQRELLVNLHEFLKKTRLAYLRGPYTPQIERFPNFKPSHSQASRRESENGITANNDNQMNYNQSFHVMTEKERVKVNKEAESCLKEAENKIIQLKASLKHFQERSQELERLMFDPHFDEDHPTDGDAKRKKVAQNLNQLLDHHTLMIIYLVDLSSQVSKYYYDQQSERLNTSIEEKQGHTVKYQSILANRKKDQIQGSRADSPIQERDIEEWNHSTNNSTGVNKKNNQNNVSNHQDEKPSEASKPHISNVPKLVHHGNKTTHQQSHNEWSSSSSAVGEQRDWRISHGLGEVDSSVDQMESGLKAQLQMENIGLLSELESMCDNIRAVERQVAMISHAQQIIAHNLMQQRDDLNHIHQQTKDATVSVSKGNKELEHAAQTSSKLRLVILMLILICAFLLLILHYFEP